MVLQKVLKWPCDYAMVGYQGGADKEQDGGRHEESAVKTQRGMQRPYKKLDSSYPAHILYP